MKYEYLCVDKSITYPWLKRFLWAPALKFIPSKRSANSITLWATLFSIICFVFLALVPITRAPDEAFVIPAIALFLYLSLDNIDGAQARRTASSSPLGEFLDHWADAFNLGFIVLGYGLAMHLEPWLIVLTLGLCAVAFYATMWEQRVTGWLNFGPLGSIEGILLVCILYLLVAGLGYEAIAQTPILGPMTFNHCFAAFFCAGFAHTAISAIIRVRRPLRDFLPLVATMTLGGLWYGLGDVAFFPVALFLAFASAFMGGRQIISRVLGTRYDANEWAIMAGIAFGAFGGTMLGWTAGQQESIAWLLVTFVAARLTGDFFSTTTLLADHLRPNELLGLYFHRSR